METHLKLPLHLHIFIVREQVAGGNVLVLTPEWLSYRACQMHGFLHRNITFGLLEANEMKTDARVFSRGQKKKQEGKKKQPSGV